MLQTILDPSKFHQIMEVIYTKIPFFFKTIPDWNGLANNIVVAESVEAFKTRLSKDDK